MSVALARRRAGWAAHLHLNPGIQVTVIAIFVLSGAFASFVAPHSPIDGSLPNKLLPPALLDGGKAEFFLGTDRQGRDLLSRIIFGTQISMSLALLAILLEGAIGTIIGLLAGYCGGWIDSLAMRVVDVGLSIPVILVGIVLAVTIGPSYFNIILIVSVLLWPRFARLIRAEALSLKEQDYVAYARVAGHSHARIVLRHILPNVVPTVIVLCTLDISNVILLEASLSFLGVGIPPPNPSWGGMVADGRPLIFSAPWVSLFPGLAITAVVLSLNFFGDWVRDRLDPKLRQV